MSDYHIKRRDSTTIEEGKPDGAIWSKTLVFYEWFVDDFVGLNDSR